MADTTTETTVAAIVDQLLPLSQTTTGAPLLAADWNALANSVIALARLALAREQADDDVLASRYAPRVHDHVGEVSASWFDPATRDLLDQASNGSALLKSDIATVSAQLTAAQKDIVALRDQLGALQQRMDKLADGDLTRQQTLDRVGVRIEALRDVQDGVVKLQGNFTGLTTRLDQALAFRNQLLDANGKPLDLGGLNTRVQTLEVNQQNLQGADGKLVRLRDFEIRIAAIEGRSLTRDDLDSTIGERVKAIGASALVEAALPQLTSQFQPQFSDLGARIDKVDAKAEAVGGRLNLDEVSLGGLSQRLTVSEAQVAQIGALSTRTDGLTTRVGASEASLQQQAMQLAGVRTAPDRLSALEGQLGDLTPLASRMDSAESSLKKLGAGVDRIDALSTRIDKIEPVLGQVSDLSQRVGVVETRVSKNISDLSSFGSQLTVLQSSATDASQRLIKLERTRIDTGPGSVGNVLTPAAPVSTGPVIAGGVTPVRGGGG